MKKKLILYLTLFLISFNAGAQWQKTGGPINGNTLGCLALKGQTVIAGMQGGGIYSSANNGGLWQSIYNNLPDPGINALAVMGSTIFAAVSSGPLATYGVYASDDNGLTWNLRNIGFSGSTNMSAFAVNGPTLYTGSMSGPLYFSTNNAISWTPVVTGLPAMTGISTMCAVGNTLLIGAFPAGIYRSTSNGSGCVAVPTGLLPNSKIISWAVSGGTIYAGVSQMPPQNFIPANSVLMSTDNGSTWTGIGAGLNSSVAGGLTVVGSTLFACNAGGVYMTANNGTSWTTMNNGLTNTNVLALTGDNTRLFVSTTTGMFVSQNNGVSWTSCNTGLVNSWTKPLLAVGNDIYTGVYGTNGPGVYETSNAGSTWTYLNNGLADEVNVLAASGSSLYAGTRSQGIFRSVNNGGSWTPFNSGLTSVNSILYINDIAFKGSNMFTALYAGSYFKSSNGGLSWTAINLGTPAIASALAVKGNTLFAGTANAGLFVSYDDGATWSPRSIPNPNGDWIWTIKIKGNSIFMGSLYGNALVSSDDGYTWTNITNSGLPSRINSFAFDVDTIYAATWGQGVFKSITNGTSWVPFNTGLCNQFIWDLLVTGGALYASSASGGVFKIGLNSLPTGVPEQSQELSDLAIYPNPFSSSAILVFKEEVNNGTLKMTDALGREVLIRQFSGASLEIEKGSLANGVYILSVSSATGPVATKKIIIH